jgi:hypothetical protein
VQGNDGYLYLFIDEQTPYIWKKVQIGVKAVGNILQSDHVSTDFHMLPQNRKSGPDPHLRSDPRSPDFHLSRGCSLDQIIFILLAAANISLNLI